MLRFVFSPNSHSLAAALQGRQGGGGWDQGAPRWHLIHGALWTCKGVSETHTLALILLVQSGHQKASDSRSADVSIHKPGRSCGEWPDRLAGACSPPRFPGLARAAAWLPAARLCLSGKQPLPSGCHQGQGLGIAESNQAAGRAGAAALGALRPREVRAALAQGP